MGRELRRVPMDFDWPLHKVWDGYLNPHGKPCPASHSTCFNGATAAGQWLSAVCRFLALAASQDAHPYFEQFPQAPRYETPRGIKVSNGSDLMRVQRERPKIGHVLPMPPDFQEFVRRLAGNGSPNLEFQLEEQLKKFAGVDGRWGVCSVCGGDGIDPSVKETYDAWEPSDPPEGAGFQLWTTTNEGAPISPVFETLDALCAYLEPHVCVFALQMATKEEWKKMLEDDFVHVESVLPNGSKVIFM
jgi:hypothetical protein